MGLFNQNSEPPQASIVSKPQSLTQLKMLPPSFLCFPKLWGQQSPEQNSELNAEIKSNALYFIGSTELKEDCNSLQELQEVREALNISSAGEALTHQSCQNKDRAPEIFQAALLRWKPKSYQHWAGLARAAAIRTSQHYAETAVSKLVLPSLWYLFVYILLPFLLQWWPLAVLAPKSIPTPGRLCYACQEGASNFQLGQWQL